MFSKLQKNVSDVLELPPDVIGEGPKVTIYGKSEVLVENFLEIITFENEEVRISTIIGDLCLVGRGLILKVLLPTELRIEGELLSISYEEGKMRNAK